MRYYILTIALTAFLLTVSGALLAKEDTTDLDFDTVKPHLILSKKEHNWINNTCKALHPISHENYEKCVVEKEKARIEKKAKEESKK